MKTTYTTKTATYTITTQTDRRVVGFENGKPIWNEYTQYNILRDGKMVRFCFNEADIPEMIDIEENGHGIYTTGEETCEETFANIEEAKAYYEDLIIQFIDEDELEFMDYVTIFQADEDGYPIKNIETYLFTD